MNTEAIWPLVSEMWVKVALILLLGLAGAWLIRRQPAEIRHGFWLPLFLLVLAVPLLLVTLPRIELVPNLTRSPAKQPIEEPVRFQPVGTADYEVIGVPRTRGEPEPQSGSITDRPATLDWKLILLSLWGVGVGFFVLRWGVAARQLRRLRITSALPDTNPIFGLMEKFRRESGVSRPVCLIQSAKIRAPFSWGVLRPVIALPQSAKKWDARDLEMILRHELAHLARYDGLIVLLTGLATALHWFNPLVWWATRKVAGLREEICDRRVLQSGFDPEKYAALLFQQARQKAAPYPFSATAAAKPGTLETRVKTILNMKTENLLQPDSSFRIRRAALVSFAALLSFGVALIGIVRPGFAETEQGNQRLVIHVHSDEESDNREYLKFQLDGEEIAEKKLKAVLSKNSKTRPVLIVEANGLPPAKDMSRVLRLIESSGVSHLSFTVRSPQVAVHVDKGARVRSIDSIYSGMVGNPGGAQKPFSSGRKDPRGGVWETTLTVTAEPARNLSALEEKLNRIQIPIVDFVDTPLEQVLDFLGEKSIDHDEDSDPENRGVNLVLKGAEPFQQKPVTLRLANISLAQALKLAAETAGADVRVDEHAVFFQPFVGQASAPHLGNDPEARKRVEQKLKAIRIPQIEFRDTPLRESLEFLRERSIELDPEPDPSKKGINIVMVRNIGADMPIDLKLKNIPLSAALDYATDLAEMKYRVEGNAVVVFPKGSHPSRDPFGGGGFDEMMIPSSGRFEGPGIEAGGAGLGGLDGDPEQTPAAGTTAPE
ncbi:MAG: M56 family metallopeptidase [Verrucomicrobiales bacterium]|nr:M56 family metallopeptidase [Verrucomicrobiales bacterium]